MRKKIFIFLIVILFTVLLSALISNKFKKIIISSLPKDIKVEKIKITPFMINLENVMISDPSSHDKNLVEIKNIVVNFKILEILTKRDFGQSIDKIEINNPRIKLKRENYT